MVNAFKILEEKNLLEDSDGAKIVNLEVLISFFTQNSPQKYKLPNVVIKSRLGATLYITRDLACAKNRYDRYVSCCFLAIFLKSIRYKFDKSIYVVASPQTTHFKYLQRF